MNAYEPSLQLTLLIVLFTAVYLIYVLRKLLRGAIDLYDFVMLSALAAIPALFVLWPGFANFIGRTLGIRLPLTVMFGALFLVVFLLLHQLISKLHRVEWQNRLLVQELSLLKAVRQNSDSDAA